MGPAARACGRLPEPVAERLPEPVAEPVALPGRLATNRRLALPKPVAAAVSRTQRRAPAERRTSPVARSSAEAHSYPHAYSDAAAERQPGARRFARPLAAAWLTFRRRAGSADAASIRGPDNRLPRRMNTGR